MTPKICKENNSHNEHIGDWIQNDKEYTIYNILEVVGSKHLRQTKHLLVREKITQIIRELFKEMEMTILEQEIEKILEIHSDLDRNMFLEGITNRQKINELIDS